MRGFTDSKKFNELVEKLGLEHYNGSIVIDEGTIKANMGSFGIIHKLISIYVEVPLCKSSKEIEEVLSDTELDNLITYCDTVLTVEIQTWDNDEDEDTIKIECFHNMNDEFMQCYTVSLNEFMEAVEKTNLNDVVAEDIAYFHMNRAINYK